MMAENPQGSSPHASISQAERRTHPRRKLDASVAMMEVESGNRCAARLADLAMGGCGDATPESLPIGAEVNVEITKDARTIRPNGRVVTAQEAGKEWGSNCKLARGGYGDSRRVAR